MKNFWNWLKSLFGFGKKAEIEAPPVIVAPQPTNPPEPPVATPPPPAQVPTNPTPTEQRRQLEIALAITSKYEGKGFTQVTGDFDQQGMSVGILQWCFGQGSLQSRVLSPYIKKYGSIDKLGIFPGKVDHLASASVATALSYCRANMLKGTAVKADWLSAWTKFMGSPQMIEIQMENCQRVANSAIDMMKSLKQDSLRAFCFCFDVVVQNGSLNGVSAQLPDRAALKKEITAFKVGSTGATDWGKNKSAWLTAADKMTDEQVSLLRVALKRASLSRPQYTGDVANRKGAIIVGSGWVHGALMSYPQLAADAAPTVPKPVAVPAPVASPANHKVPTREEMTAVATGLIEGTIPNRLGVAYKKIRETEGKNRSREIDMIITKQGGKLAEPYCQYGQQEFLDELCSYYGIDRKLVKIPEGGGTLNTYRSVPAKYKIKSPIPMSWTTWRHGETEKGHVGMNFTVPVKGTYHMFEFNTSAGSSVVRDGEGAMWTDRTTGKIGDMVVFGYTDVYQALVDAMKS